MSFFGKPRKESAVLVDVASDSVGGACAVFEVGEPSALAYTKRVLIEIRAGETADAAFARALAELGEGLIREGAPALMRVAGSGHAERIVANIGAPWAESSVRIERMQADSGTFIFTKAIIDKALKEPENVPTGKIFLDEAILATFLDGYESRDAVGERAHHASIIVLSTLVDRAVAEPLAAALRALYHTRDVSLAAGALALHRGLEALFPHESEYLALAASGAVGTLLLVRKGVLLAAPNLSLANDPADALEKAFAELSRTQPLPHSVFLVAEQVERESLKDVFSDKRFAPLWLSDNPPRVLPVLPEHLQLGAKLSLIGDAKMDLRLGLLALFCAQGSA